MKLKAFIDDIESICRTCDTCDPSCAGYTFKNCFESELEFEEAFQLVNFKPSAPDKKVHSDVV